MRQSRRWGWLGLAVAELLSWGCGDEGTTLYGDATGGQGPSGTAGTAAEAGQPSGGGRAGEAASSAGAGGATHEAGAGRSGALWGGANSDSEGGAPSGGVDAGGAAGTAGLSAGAGGAGGGALVAGAAGAGGVGNGGAGGSTTYGDVPDTPACAAYREDDRWTVAWASVEAEVVDLVNAERRAGTDCPDADGGVVASDPVDEVTVNPEVRCAARAHSYDMADRDYYSSGTWDDSADECAGPADTCPTAGYICRQQIPGLDPYRCLQGAGPRLTEAGYAYNGYFEVIGSNYPTAGDLVSQWMDDPGLCVDLMDGTFVDIGVGYTPGPGTGESRWTVILAVPQ